MRPKVFWCHIWFILVNDLLAFILMLVLKRILREIVGDKNDQLLLYEEISLIVILKLFVLFFRRMTRAVCTLSAKNPISCFLCPQFEMNGGLYLTCLILKVLARFPWTTLKWPLTAENSSPTFLLGKSLSSRLLEIVSRWKNSIKNQNTVLLGVSTLQKRKPRYFVTIFLSWI